MWLVHHPCTSRHAHGAVEHHAPAWSKGAGAKRARGFDGGARLLQKKVGRGTWATTEAHRWRTAAGYQSRGGEKAARRWLTGGLMEEGLGAVARCGRDDSKQCRAALLRRRSRTGAPAWWRSVAMARRRGALPPRFLPWRGGGRAPFSSLCAWCRILLSWRDGGFKLLLPFLASPPGFSPSSLAWSASSVSRWWRRRRRLGRMGRRLGFATSAWGVI